MVCIVVFFVPFSNNHKYLPFYPTQMGCRVYYGGLVVVFYINVYNQRDICAMNSSGTRNGVFYLWYAVSTILKADSTQLRIQTKFHLLNENFQKFYSIG